MAGKHIFVEQWKCKDAWLALPVDQRRDFAKAVEQASGAMQAHGIRSLGWGVPAPSIDHPATTYGFWAVWEMESGEGVQAFMQGVAASGWYDFFEQENTAGVAQTPSAVLELLVNAGHEGAR